MVDAPGRRGGRDRGIERFARGCEGAEELGPGERGLGAQEARACARKGARDEAVHCECCLYVI
jgi:hypothetical protein